VSYIDSINKIVKAVRKACTANKIPLAGDPADFFQVLNLENVLQAQFTSIQFCTKRLNIIYYFEESVFSMAY